MNMTKLDEILESERVAFRKTVESAMEEASARRSEFKSQIAELVGINLKQSMSEEEFFSAVNELQKISSLDLVWDQVGFSRDSYQNWINESSAPKAPFRCSTIQILLDAVIDYYANAKLASELSAIVEQLAGVEPAAQESISEMTQLLSKRLNDIDKWSSSVSVRTSNLLKNADIVTVGELVALSEGEVLRLPNCGSKSLIEIKGILAQLNLSLGCLDYDEIQQVTIRRKLNENAGQQLTTEWCIKVKPEYQGLEYFERQQKRQRGEEPYEWAKADPELVLALHRAGITEKTELATAPKGVLLNICIGHEDWYKQLPRLLKRAGRLVDEPVHYYWDKDYTLELHLPVPPCLNENVNVYKGK